MIAAALVASSVIHSTAHATLYSIADLGTLGGDPTLGYAVNASGQVAGYARTAGSFYHAFFQSNGTITDIGTLGGSDSYVSFGSINDAGVVVGATFNASGAGRAFRYDSVSHTKLDIGTLGGTGAGATGVNNLEQITGSSLTAGNAANHGFIWTNGVFTEIGTFGGANTFANDINDLGQVAGASEYADGTLHAFFRRANGTMVDLGATVGNFVGNYSQAYSMNDLGDVVGYVRDANNFTAGFIWSEANGMQALGALPSGASADGIAVNNHSEVVGDTGIGAFYWSNSTGIVDLNTLLVPGSGWSLGLASGINDSGQITGWGTIGGETHAFLLTPVPEPSAFMLMAFGALSLVGLRWRQKRIDA